MQGACSNSRWYQSLTTSLGTFLRYFEGTSSRKSFISSRSSLDHFSGIPKTSSAFFPYSFFASLGASLNAPFLALVGNFESATSLSRVSCIAKSLNK